MDQKIIREQIASSLEMLQEQYEVIRKNEGIIPQIDLDILLNSTRNLYEALLHLNKANSTGIVLHELEKHIEKEPAESKYAEPVQEEVIADLESRHDETEIINAEVKDEPLKEIVQVTVEQKLADERTKTISKTSKVASKSGNLFEEATMIADKFEGKETVHDKFSKSKEDKSLADKLSNLPLQDLKKSIGINEKFKFVNELFDGNLQEYNDSIDFLNACPTFSEAENFVIKNLQPKYNWKKESGVYQSLLFLIQRKFNF